MYTWKTHIHRNQPIDSRYIWQYLLNEVCAIKICPSAEFLLRNAILLVFINIHKISRLLLILVSYCVYQSAQPTSCKSDWFLMWSIVAEPSLHLYLSYYFCTSDTWKRYLAVFSQSKACHFSCIAVLWWTNQNQTSNWKGLIHMYCYQI